MFHQGGGLLLAGHLLVARLGRFVFRLHPVVLLDGDGMFLYHLRVPFVVGLGILQADGCFADTRIGHQNVALCGTDGGVHGILSYQCILVVGFSLCQTQQVFRVLNHQQGVSLVDFLVFFEIDFLDESRHAGVDGSDVLFHLCIVGVFHVAQVDEMTAHPHNSCEDDDGKNDIRNLFVSFYISHDV